MADHGYVLDNTWKAARERLALLEDMYDPWTTKHMEALGVSAGWSCLELAGGGGSMTKWLCQQVGPSGRVLATDLETCFLDTIDATNLEVRRHDIVTEDLPKAAFDLVHARAVLCFLPDQDRVLRKMVAALKPGGWLLAEEPDFVSAVPDPSMKPTARAVSEKGSAAVSGYLESRGYHAYLGSGLYGALVGAGLSGVGAEGLVRMNIGGTPVARFRRLSTEQMQDGLLTAGLITAEELEQYYVLLDSPDHRCMNAIMMSAWGQRTA
jgi:SAM-dependent methyltransferase